MSNKNYFFKSKVKQVFGSFVDYYEEYPERQQIVFMVTMTPIALSELECLRSALDFKFNDIDFHIKVFSYGAYFYFVMDGVEFP